MYTMPQLERRVTVGIDSHKEVHVAAAVDQVGRILATTQAPTTLRGYAQLERWACELGRVERFGVEGTGSYAAGLARWLTGRGWQVVEVNRPNRHKRRRRGKSDPVDAEAAARAALAGDDTTTPKAATGAVEMLRALRVARRSAVKARSQAANQLDSLVVTAPDQLRAQLRQLPAARLVETAAALRPGELTAPWRRSSSPCASWHAATRPSAPRSTGSTLTSAGWRAGPPLGCWPGAVSAPKSRPPCWSPLATTPPGWQARPRSRRCAAPHRLRRPRARRSAIASTVAGTDRPTTRCGRS
jgi:hypothetical protein